MQIVLLERIERLGQMGQVVTVKPGYARNYLLPRKKAMRATKENLAYFEQQRVQLEAHNLKLKSEAESVAKTMNNVQVVIIRQASEVGHLYGSVRSQDVSEALTAAGYTVNKTQVQINTPVKTLGIHELKVVLHPEVAVAVSVLVAQSAEEAEVIMQKAQAAKSQPAAAAEVA